MSERIAIPRVDSRGLDFQNLDGITPEEVQAYRADQLKEDGNAQSGFDYLMDVNPRALKSYRYFATSIQPPYRDPRFAASVFGWLGYYAYLDFDEGVRYSVTPVMRAGFTRAQVEEGMSIAFMCGGTRALVTIGRALADYQWPEPAEDVNPWPDDWQPDPAAFASGLDFSTNELLPGEQEKIVGWYEGTIDWVPSWVHYFGRHNQRALKGWRYRYENALVTLPKQILPLSFITAGVQFKHEELLRENVLLARAFGTTLDDVLQSIDTCAVYGTEKVGFAYRHVGDLLDAWAGA